VRKKTKKVDVPAKIAHDFLLAIINNYDCMLHNFTNKKFLRAKAAKLLSARLSHRNSVRPSVSHTGGSVKSGAS